MDETQDTGEFVAAHWPNLDCSFLDRINKLVGQMRKTFSGNGFVKIPWRGGNPGKPELYVKLPTNEQ
jgi:hypothetical protein